MNGVNLLPAFRRRTELLDGMCKRVEVAGGQVVRTQRLVMPVKGIGEKKATFYALFTTYPQRRGAWYVCEPSHGRPYWAGDASANEAGFNSSTPT